MLVFFRLNSYGVCTKCTSGGIFSLASANATLENVAESFVVSFCSLVREESALESTAGNGAGRAEHLPSSELTVESAVPKSGKLLEASVYGGGVLTETWLAARLADPELAIFAMYY